MTYKLGSLFDGSGGFPLAGTLCGIEPLWAAEVEPYPIAVTRTHFPKMRHLGDVCTVSGAEIEPVDIITFGSPCQDLSVAGKRAGLKHEAHGDGETTRSGLFMEAVRIIKEMRRATDGIYPTFALWENVPGAFSSHKGEDFRVVLEELIKIVEPHAVMPPVPARGWAYADSYRGDGWSLAYRVFDAQYWGVPQRRRRIHLVLDLGGGRAEKVLFEREVVRGYFAAGTTLWQTAAADAARGVGAGDRAREKPSAMGICCPDPLIATREPFCKSSRARSADDATTWIPGKVANTLNTFDRGEARASELIVEAPVYCLQGNGIDRADMARCNGNGRKEGVSYTLNTVDRPATTYAMMRFGNYTEDDCATTLKACDSKHPTDLVCKQVYAADAYVRYIVRRLTPTECARLQGFPDWWGDIGAADAFTDEEYRFWLGVRNTHATINGKATKEYTAAQMLTWYNKLHTDSAEYKMWGNGIALPPALYCMQGMAEALKSGQALQK